MKKGETNFAYTDDRGTDSLDKDSLKQLKETGSYQVKRSQAMNTKCLLLILVRKIVQSVIKQSDKH